VQQRAATVAVLRTYLTGELFASLREGGTLAPLMAAETSPAASQAAFDAGVRALGEEELSHALFGARARVMAAGAVAAGSADYVSGLLMAAEWRDARRRGLSPVEPVRLVGEPALCARHARCAQHFGYHTTVLEPETVQRAAWRALLPPWTVLS
jgi:2-dehydro-3-deoxygalactonokinase